MADEVFSAGRGREKPEGGAPGAAQPFTHLGVPHAEQYRRLLRMFARAKERFVVHLRPEDVAAELRAEADDQLTEALDQFVRGLNRPWINYCFCIPHAFHLSDLVRWGNLRADVDGVGDMRTMIRYASAKLAHIHVADCYNHRANAGNRYIVNPPGVDARVHQHNEIGHGDIDWDETFAALRDVTFDGIAAVCVFGWEEDADAIHRRMLDRVTAELAAGDGGAPPR